MADTWKVIRGTASTCCGETPAMAGPQSGRAGVRADSPLRHSFASGKVITGENVPMAGRVPGLAAKCRWPCGRYLKGLREGGLVVLGARTCARPASAPGPSEWPEPGTETWRVPQSGTISGPQMRSLISEKSRGRGAAACSGSAVRDRMTRNRAGNDATAGPSDRKPVWLGVPHRIVCG